MARRSPRAIPSARGASLIEALVALLVLSIGMVGVARLQGQLRLGADLARQQAEATRLAQSDLEALRGFSALAAGSPGLGFEDIAPQARSVGGSAGMPLNTRFDIQREVQPGDGYRGASLTVRWTDRAGQPRHVRLDSLFAATAPALSGALVQRAQAPPVARLRGRSALVPFAAQPLGNGRSALKPTRAAGVAWVFDDTTGALVERCGVPASAAVLAAADLSGCVAWRALLLSGIVRRSAAADARPEHANDAPLPLDVVLALADPLPRPAPPECLAEAQKLVALPGPDGTRRIGVPLDAVPADWGVTAWTEIDDRYVAYHCAVPIPQGHWSGRTTIVPRGWHVGTGRSDWQVCRYSADHDGSGAVDQNDEHPNHYHRVDRPLMQQNFLLVPGPAACPAAPVVPAASATVAHQP